MPTPPTPDIAFLDADDAVLWEGAPDFVTAVRRELPGFLGLILLTFGLAFGASRAMPALAALQRKAQVSDSIRLAAPGEVAATEAWGYAAEVVAEEPPPPTRRWAPYAIGLAVDVGLALALLAWMRRLCAVSRYIARREGLEIRSGVIVADTKIIPYERIESVEVDRWFMDAGRSVGDLLLRVSEHADGQVRLDAVPDPEDVARALMAKQRERRRAIGMREYNLNDAPLFRPSSAGG